MNDQINPPEGPHVKLEPSRFGRRPRMTTVAMLSGLAAVVAVGLTTQSPLSAATLNAMHSAQAPSEAQLPWDDNADTTWPNQDRDPMDSWGDFSAHPDDMHRHRNGGGPQGGPDGPMADRGPGAPRELLGIVAQTLNIPVQDLVAEMRNGKSIADVAADKKVPVQDVIDAIVEQVTKNVTERVTDFVNRTPRDVQHLDRSTQDRPAGDQPAQGGSTQG